MILLAGTEPVRKPCPETKNVEFSSPLRAWLLFLPEPTSQESPCYYASPSGKEGTEPDSR